MYKMKIKLYNKIASCGLARLPEGYVVGEDVEEADGIIVRSAALHDVEFPKSVRAIARAGAGVNNIPLDKCTQQGICVFNTPGANAGAVKELCIAALLMSSRKLVDGIEWAKKLEGNPDAAKLVEKGKSQFVGPEILGKTLGVIGLGAIGGMLANAALDLGMKVIGYDPYVSVKAAWAMNPQVKLVSELDEIFKNSDYISIHVPSLPSTRGTYCKAAFEKMKDGVRLLNLARADLAVEEDVLEYIENGKIAVYFTDFPTPAVIGKKGVIATPHLGASTPEAEDNCAVMACNQIVDFLENGNIKNSVNMPAVSLARGGKYRVGVFYKTSENAELALAPLTVGAKTAKASRGEYTYALFDGEKEFDLDKIHTIPEVITVASY